jgi:hypothetical protein
MKKFQISDCRLKVKSKILNLKATSKNVIPAEAGTQKILISLDSRLRGSDELVIVRGSLKSKIGPLWNKGG